jgi:cyclopropane fatty-acyl-phospholipid synthase-like methyltransferase
MCLPGLHEAVAQKIAYRISPDSCVLDIAAGSGAFTRRLMDMGISPVANDVDPSRWRVPQIDLMNVDLNGAFAEAFAGRGIDAIAAIEVIEHLENPREFLRQCRAIIPAGGFMFVTTPNVTSAASRAMFLRSGRTVFFARGGDCGGDHITFLPWWLLVGHAEAAGWEVVETTFAGQHANLGFKVRIARFLAAMLGRYDQPAEKKFGCTLMTLRKS